MGGDGRRRKIPDEQRENHRSGKTRRFYGGVFSDESGILRHNYDTSADPKIA